MGEGEVVVVELISLPYRHPRACIKLALRPIRRLWRQSCRTADRGRKYKAVEVHCVLRRLLLWLRLWLLLDLRLLVGRSSQLLCNAAGSSPGRRPRARGWRGHQFIALWN